MERISELTEEQLQAELAHIMGLDDIVDDAPGIVAMQDMIERYGLTRDIVRTRLDNAVRRGKMERVRVWRTGSDGRRYIARAYRIAREQQTQEVSK
jgi:hypothetical protein